MAQLVGPIKAALEWACLLLSWYHEEETGTSKPRDREGEKLQSGRKLGQQEK
jgi:hypothetical protein